MRGCQPHWGKTFRRAAYVSILELANQDNKEYNLSVVPEAFAFFYAETYTNFASLHEWMLLWELAQNTSVV